MITGAADAAMLYAVTNYSRAAAAAADSNRSASLVTVHMLAPHALIEVSLTTGRAAGDGSSSKVDNQRFTVLRS